MKTKKITKKITKFKKQLNHRVKLTLVPHKKNQYRPHLIRRYGLAVMILLVIGVQIGYNYSITGSVLGAQATVEPTDLLADTNRYRAEQQLAPLQLDAQLSQAAFLKGQDMFTQQYWAHVAPDGSTPWKWFTAAGYNYAFAGENLAKNFTTADAATTAWMKSPKHKANMMDKNYSQVGFAVVDGILNDKSASIIVALYGQPATATTAVAGTQTAAVVEAPQTHTIGLLTRVGMAAQSMTPAALGAVMMLLFATMVAFMAHMRRQKLPKALRQSWYRHHGIIKAGGMLSITILVLALYSGGQI